MICDYYIVRRRVLVVNDLYLRHGLYEYSRGFNRNAIIALVSGTCAALIGLLVPTLRFLYDYSWFVGFAIAFGVYFDRMQLANRRWGVVPHDEEMPKFSRSVTVEERPQLEKFWERIAELQKHEDTLFNSRLQGFLLTTSFLLAAFAQFKDGEAFAAARIAFCLFALMISIFARRVLRRTVVAIQWYLRVLVDLDEALFSANMGPYRTRRLLTKGLEPTKSVPVIRPVSTILGLWVPSSVVILWVFLLFWSLSHR
jgi:hypothetical protein